MVRYRDRVVGIERIKARDLVPHPSNWRTHPKAQSAALKGILAEVGIAGALLVYKRKGEAKYTIIDGHLRANTAKDQEWPVIVLDVNDDEARYLLATHDPLAAMAQANQDRMLELLASIEPKAQAVRDMLEALANGETQPLLNPVEDVEPRIDEAEELRKKWGVERGQVWTLGEHRLMCGDATSEKDHAALIGNAKIDLVLTDPPYGVGIKYESFDDTTERVDALVAGYLPLVRRWPVCLITPGCYAMWRYPHPTWTLAWVHPAGSGRGPWGFTMLNPILAYGADPYLKNARGSHPDVLVLAADRDGLDLHPVAKPLRVWEWCMERGSINRGDGVLDPFLGSGTTIIAAERLGRRCYAMEIEPKYVAVSLQRWADATGKTPVLA